MTQALRKQNPSLVAAHLAAFTTVSEAPELHLPAYRGREPAYRAEVQVLYPQWWRHPAIVLRGWQPRAIEPGRSLGERLAGAVAAAVRQVRTWRERARSRQALLNLDDHMLRDLGISRATADFKGSQPFWRTDD
ncbi:MAG TPA: DUF1127 domain-containing protein [Stellaceae bacterium]|nr:DUF1127 domain-containing protein [Stellaceae bacterium]